MTGFSPGDRGRFVKPGEITACQAQGNCRVVCNILAEAVFIRRSGTIEAAYRISGKCPPFGKFLSFKKWGDDRRVTS